MTTELVLLLGLFAFLAGGAFFSDKGPFATFSKSGPRLAARIEQHVTVGRSFKIKNGSTQQWLKPETNAPDGSL